MIKTEIRKAVSVFRGSLDKNSLEEMNEEIFKKVTKGKVAELIGERPVFIYASYNNEADTFKIADFFMKKGNIIAYPKVLNKNREMSFYRVNSTKELIKGYRGILEPLPKTSVDEISKEAVIIVPMVAFDKKLNRVGYGGGFYDTYLINKPPYMKIGIAFEKQCFNIDDVEENDIKMDYIVTEKNIWQ